MALPAKGPLLTRTGWSAFIIALIAVCAVAPLLNLAVPADSAFHMSTYAVALLGKIMCYAICALAMDLIWGYTGILSLGHGVFFALGGYVMGMYLMRQIGKDGNYKSDLPDFMVFLDWKTLPWHWTFSDSFAATLLLIVAVPGVLGWARWMTPLSVKAAATIHGPRRDFRRRLPLVVCTPTPYVP